MLRSPLRKKIFQLSFIALMELCLSTVFAGGFQLWEESATGTGDYHAGGAAEANDAGTTFYNPAGMIRIDHPEFSVGAVFIPVAISFNGTVGGLPTVGYISGNTHTIVPNAHFVLPMTPKVAIGLGITTPFGLATNYPGNAQPLATAATLTKMETVNINPNVAFAIDERLSIAIGFDALYGKARYNSNILGSTAFNNKLSAWGYGWNGGVLYQFTHYTRFGISYRSEISVDGEGRSDAITPFSAFSNNTLNAVLNLPAMTIISFYSDVTSKWSLMASAYYTEWSLFDDLLLVNTVLFPTIAVHENYHNTWNYAIGAHYHVTHRITLKAGIGWDETPTVDGCRDVRLPDAKRFAAAIGGHFQWTPFIALDLGWTHFFTKAANVNNSLSGLSNFLVTVGTAKVNVNVFGVQLTAQLD